MFSRTGVVESILVVDYHLDMGVAEVRPHELNTLKRASLAGVEAVVEVVVATVVMVMVMVMVVVVVKVEVVEVAVVAVVKVEAAGSGGVGLFRWAWRRPRLEPTRRTRAAYGRRYRL